MGPTVNRNKAGGGLIAGLVACCFGLSSAEADRETCTRTLNTLERIGAGYLETLRQEQGPEVGASLVEDIFQTSRTLSDGCLVYDFGVPRVCSSLVSTLQRDLTERTRSVQVLSTEIEANIAGLERTRVRYPTDCADHQSAQAINQTLGLTTDYLQDLHSIRARLSVNEIKLEDARRSLDRVVGLLMTPRSFVPRPLTQNQARIALSSLRRNYAGNSSAFGSNGAGKISKTGVASGLEIDLETGLLRIQTEVEDIEPGPSGTTRDLQGETETRKQVLEAPLESVEISALPKLPSLQSSFFKAQGLGAHVSDFTLLLTCVSSCEGGNTQSLRLPFDDRDELNQFAIDFLNLKAYLTKMKALAATKAAALEARRAEAAALPASIKNKNFLTSSDYVVSDFEAQVEGISTDHCAHDRKFKQTLGCRYQHWIVRADDASNAMATFSLEVLHRGRRTESKVQFSWYRSKDIGRVVVIANGRKPLPLTSCSPISCMATSKESAALLDLLLGSDAEKVQIKAFDDEDLEVFDYTFGALGWAAAHDHALEKAERAQNR